MYAPPTREGFPGIGDLGLVSGEKTMEAGMSEQDENGMTLLQRVRARAETPEGKAWDAQLDKAAARWKWRLGDSPFFAARAKQVEEQEGSDWSYWRSLAASAPYA